MSRNGAPIKQLDLKLLNFAYSSQNIFEQANFIFKAGQITQLHGHNGSGKTTLLKILAGLIAPDTDSLWINHRQDNASKLMYQQNLLYVGHKAALKPQLTLLQNLQLDLLLHNISTKNSELDKTTDIWTLPDLRTTLAGDLSFGQQRKLALCRLILIPRQVWLLDEPFQGLDQKSCQILAQMLDDHVQNQGIVVLSNHQIQATPEIKSRVDVQL